MRAVFISEGARGLVRHPLRTTLALAGLVVGVSSVVGSFALLTGAHRFALAAAAQRSRLNVLTVESPRDVIRNGRVLSVPKPVRLTAADLRLLCDVPGVRDGMPYSESTLPVRNEGIAFEVRVYGVGANAVDFLPMDLSMGRFFSREESDSAARVAVLSTALAEDLFGTRASAVGREMSISGQRFDVVGVVEIPKDSFSGDDRRACYVPHRAKEERLGPTLFDSQVFLAARSIDNVAAVREGLDAPLSRLRSGVSKANFVVETSENEIRSERIASGLLGVTLGGVALLALLVAGSGILNTLLVGVRQRTREIGTRRALGATRVAIRAQFLAEALLLSLPGAAAGVVLGAQLAKALGARFASGLIDPSLLRVSVGVREALVGAVAAILVSIAAGVVPASRAASVDPAEALRYE